MAFEFSVLLCFCFQFSQSSNVCSQTGEVIFTKELSNEKFKVLLFHGYHKRVWVACGNTVNIFHTEVCCAQRKTIFCLRLSMSDRYARNWKKIVVRFFNLIFRQNVLCKIHQ